MISGNIFHTSIIRWRWRRTSNYMLIEYSFRGYQSLIEVNAYYIMIKYHIQNSKVLYTFHPPTIIKEIIILSNVAMLAENFDLCPFDD